MLVKVYSEQLKAAFGKLLSITDKKNSRPILAYTLVEAKDGKMFLSGTDLEVSGKIIFDAFVEKAGFFCVNAKNIFDILKEFPNALITLELDEAENILNLRHQDIHFSLLVYNTSDFPHLSFENKNNEFKLNSDDLLLVIDKIFHAVSFDETRSYLNGIFLQKMDSKLRAIATDGHRLALVDLPFSERDIEALNTGIIIPRKGIVEIKKLVESHQGVSIKLSMDDSFLYLNGEDQYLLSIRLVAREYPKYQSVIPNKTTASLLADRTILLDAIKRIKIMSNEKTNGIRVLLRGGEMVISANHPSFGKAVEKIPVKYAGKEMEIGFNGRYLIDTLSVFGEGEVILEFNNVLSPVVARSPHIPNGLCIIMPLKL